MPGGPIPPAPAPHPPAAISAAPLVSKLFTLPAQRIPKFFVLALALVLVAAVGPLSGRFEDAQENETTSFLPGDAESVQALERSSASRAATRPPRSPSSCASGGLTAADRAQAARSQRA